jgi:hypothetical protein
MMRAHPLLLLLLHQLVVEAALLQLQKPLHLLPPALLLRVLC